MLKQRNVSACLGLRLLLTKMIEDEVYVPGPPVGLHGGVGRGEHCDIVLKLRGVRPCGAGQQTGELKSEREIRHEIALNRIQYCY